MQVTQEDAPMPIDLILPISMIFSLIAWSLIFKWYIHPRLKTYTLQEALEPLLLLHSFRYIGLMFLVPGVTAELLDSRFSSPAAYGDLIAAVLAFVAIGMLRLKVQGAVLSVWIFNIWGLLDLLNAVTRGLIYVPNGHFGAAYWIPAMIVPLLLVSHVYIFVLLFTKSRAGGSEPDFQSSQAG